MKAAKTRTLWWTSGWIGTGMNLIETSFGVTCVWPKEGMDRDRSDACRENK